MSSSSTILFCFSQSIFVVLVICFYILIEFFSYKISDCFFFISVFFEFLIQIMNYNLDCIDFIVFAPLYFTEFKIIIFNSFSNIS
jgi:hypothetical protein